MKLISLYKSVLELGGMSADRDGFVSGKLVGSKLDPSPVTIKGKRIVLPTQKQLTTSDWSDRIVFHPLYENVLRGESQVIEKLRSLITMRINVTLGILGTALLELAANTAEHSKMNPDQSMFLAKVRMLDDKTQGNWGDLLKVLDPMDGKKNFIHVFLKRSGSIDGRKYARVGVVNFPVMKHLVNDEEVFGFKPRKKDLPVFKNLLEYIFKDILTDGAYNAGSDSSIAPYTEAMLRTFLNVIAPINDIIDLFAELRPELADLRFNSDWVEELDKLEGYHPDIKSIPMQAGNEGASLVKGVSPPPDQQPVHQAAPVAAPAPAPVQQVVADPQAWAHPQQQQFPQPPAGYQFPQNQWTPNPTMAPPLAYAAPGQYPGQYPYQSAPVASVVKSRDGADFGSILASRPELAMAAAAFTHPQQFGMMPNQQQSVPRFAQTPMQMGMGMAGMGGGYPPSTFGSGFPMGGMGAPII